MPGWAIGAIVGGTLLLLLLVGYAVMSFREGREKEDGEDEDGGDKNDAKPEEEDEREDNVWSLYRHLCR